MASSMLSTATCKNNVWQNETGKLNLWFSFFLHLLPQSYLHVLKVLLCSSCPTFFSSLFEQIWVTFRFVGSRYRHAWSFFSPHPSITSFERHLKWRHVETPRRMQLWVVCWFVYQTQICCRVYFGYSRVVVVLRCICSLLDQGYSTKVSKVPSEKMF